jgi:hypothetical protein
VAILFSGTLTTPLNIALAAAQVKIDSQDNCKEVSNGTQVDIKYSWGGFDPNTPFQALVSDDRAGKIVGTKNLQGTSNGSGTDDITVILNNEDYYSIQIKFGGFASLPFLLHCSNTKST